MAEYAVQAAAFSPVIHVGRLNPKCDSFAQKQDRTDMVLAAVAQYVERNFGGGMEADFPGLGLVLEIKVRPSIPPAVCTCPPGRAHPLHVHECPARPRHDEPSTSPGLGGSDA